jgi:NitT/TauT family transport system substrate-binding protein
MSPEPRVRSRRAFLQGMAAVVALLPVGLLQACAPAQGPTPQPAQSTAAPSPTQGTAPAASTAAPGATKGLQKVRYGDLRLLSDGGVYIGMQEGYYAEQGIEVELVSFDSAANMVAPLGTGQIEAGGGALSAGLFNAVGRGVKLLIVADKGHSDPTPPGFASSNFMVRKALWDGGQVRSSADLRGRKYGYVARGISTELDLRAFLKEGGLTIKDLDLVQMGFPDMVAAFANGAIDAASPGEPFATNIETQGSGVVLKRDYEVNPHNQVSAVLFSETMGKSDLAARFMVAYLRSVRLYNDAFVKQKPEAREKAISALINHTPVKDRPLYDRMKMQGLHPDGQLNVRSIEEQQDYFLSEGLQEKQVDFEQIVDTRFIEQARKELGAYA